MYEQYRENRITRTAMEKERDVKKTKDGSNERRAIMAINESDHCNRFSTYLDVSPSPR